MSYYLRQRHGTNLRSLSLGRRVGLHNWARPEALMLRRGGCAVLFGRFTAMFRALIPGLAEMARMRYLRNFLPWNVTGGVLWAADTTVLLGYAFSQSLDLVGRALTYGLLALMCGLTVLALIRQRARSTPVHTVKHDPPDDQEVEAASLNGRVVIVSASIGAGHDGVAHELGARLSGQGFEVEVVDFLGLLPRVLGVALRRIYAWQLRRAPLTWDLLYTALERYRPLSAVAVRLATLLAAPGTAALVDHRTRAVVSTYPLASQVLGWMRRSGRLARPVATFLCDMSVHPLWVAAGVDAHLAMHKIPADQARRFGASGITITAPVVPTRFAEVSTCPREVARAMFELPAGGRVALVLAGSWGVGEIIQTTTDVAESKLATPVVVCGHNEELRRRLRETGIGVALGWIRDMPTLLRAADVVIHNAGGLSCMEALAAGVPVLTYRPLSGHGRTNVDALSQAGLVAHADDAEGLHQLLGEVLSPGFSSVASGSVRALWTKPDAATAIAHLAGWRCEIGDGSGSPSHPELRRT